MTPKEKRLLDERNRWAQRNGELHVLLRRMHDALKAVAPEHPLIVEGELILCNVPQVRVSQKQACLSKAR